jgi:hypothetical protein
MTSLAEINNQINILSKELNKNKSDALELPESPEYYELCDKVHESMKKIKELCELKKRIKDDEELTTLIVERQNSTLEVTSAPFVSRTYEESPYARRQWEYWVREQRLRRMDEFESCVYLGYREIREVDEMVKELYKNKDKMEPEEFAKQDHALYLEEEKWYKLLAEQEDKRDACKRNMKRGLKETSAFLLSNNWTYSEEEKNWSLAMWIFYLWSLQISANELHRFMGSIYVEWLRVDRLHRQNLAFDAKRSLELQKELRELELPRLVSKRNKGLKWPLNDDQVDLFNKVASRMTLEWKTDNGHPDPHIGIRYHERWIKKMVTPMHPYVDNKLKDTLEVGDYMRVSTNQHIKHKWSQTGNYSLGCVDFNVCEFATVSDCLKEQGLVWAKFVQNNHPKYRDPQTRAEKNAKRIEAIKKAYPDYF